MLRGVLCLGYSPRSQIRIPSLEGASRRQSVPVGNQSVASSPDCTKLKTTRSKRSSVLIRSGSFADKTSSYVTCAPIRPCDSDKTKMPHVLSLNESEKTDAQEISPQHAVAGQASKETPRSVNDNDVCDVAASVLPPQDSYLFTDGWAISEALQAVFPSSPIITGFHKGACLRSWLYYHMTSDLLIVPERKAMEPITGHHSRRRAANAIHFLSRSIVIHNQDVIESRVPASGGAQPPRATFSSLLLDAASLPCGVGGRVLPPITASNLEWIEETEIASDSHKNAAENPRFNVFGSEHASAGSRLRVERVADNGEMNARKPAAANIEDVFQIPITLSNYSGTTTRRKGGVSQRVEWTSAAAYDNMQVCADVSSVSLRSFTMQELGQRAPLLLFLAEKPYAAGDEEVRGRVVLQPCVKPSENTTSAVTTTTTTRTTADVLASSRLPSLAASTRRVPVEVYAERTPLLRTTGTAALQLALQGALAGAAWLTQSGKGSENAHASDFRESPTQHPHHFVWTDSDWLVERDSQLAALEERLLQSLRRDGRTLTLPVTGCENSLDAPSVPANNVLRAWLPSRWMINSHLFMQSLALNTGALTGEISTTHSGGLQKQIAFLGSSGIGSSPFTHSTGSMHTWNACCIPCCKSWTFRLRKSWLVTGLSQRTLPIIASANEKNRKPSPATADDLLTPSGAPHINFIRQPNYNLLTGMPLNLSWSRISMTQKTTSKEHPEQDQQEHQLHLSPEKHGKWNNSIERTTAATTDTVMDTATHAKQGDGDVSTPFSLEEASERTQAKRSTHPLPFLLALNSGRVGWVPMQRQLTSDVPKSADPSPRWCLPHAVEPYVLADHAHRVHTTPLEDDTSRAPAKPSAATTAPTAAASKPSSFAGVAVPHEEWFTGFFVHDAPSWWQDALYGAWSTNEIHLKGATAEGGTSSGDPMQLQQGKTQRNAIYNSAGSSAFHGARAAVDTDGTILVHQLIERGHIPALPARTFSAEKVNEALSASNASAAGADSICADEKKAAGADASVPTVHVLRMRCGPPTVRSATEDTDTSCTEVSQLYWSTFCSDSSVGTVNFIYTLQDVAQMCEEGLPAAASACSPTEKNTLALSTTKESPVLLFVEVKAALEVVRCAITAADTSVYTWWPFLDAFHRVNTVEIDVEEDGHTCSDGTSDESSLPGSEPAAQRALTAVGAASEGRSRTSPTTVAAYAHPAPSEVVRAFVQLVTQRRSANSLKSNHLFSENSRAGNDFTSGDESSEVQTLTEDDRAFTPERAAWSKTTYDILLQAALINAHVLPSPTTSDVADAEVLGEAAHEENATEENEAGLNGNRRVRYPTSMTNGDSAAKNTLTVSTSTAFTAPPQLPYGVQVHMYDEDGTRVLTRIQNQRDDSNGFGKISNDRRAERSIRRAVDDAQSGLHFYISDEEWTAANQSSFPQTHHHIQSVTREPLASSAQAEKLKTARASALNDKDQETRVPMMYFSKSPPVPVAALGAQRAASIVAAREENKRHGYLPVARRRKQHGYKTSSSYKQTFELLSGVDVPFASTCACSGKATPEANKNADGRTETLSTVLLNQNNGNANERYVQAETEGTVSSLGAPQSTQTKSVFSDPEHEHPAPSKSCFAVPTLGVIDTLVEEERQRFHRLWRPWLKYLPPTLSEHNGHYDAYTRHSTSLAPQPVTTTATDPQTTFPFLRASRLATCHIRHQAETPSRCEKPENQPKKRRNVIKHESTAEQGEVQVPELGLSVLHVKVTEYYVNATNLATANPQHQRKTLQNSTENNRKKKRTYSATTKTKNSTATAKDKHKCYKTTPTTSKYTKNTTAATLNALETHQKHTDNTRKPGVKHQRSGARLTPRD